MSGLPPIPWYLLILQASPPFKCSSYLRKDSEQAKGNSKHRQPLLANDTVLRRVALLTDAFSYALPPFAGDHLARDCPTTNLPVT